MQPPSFGALLGAWVVLVWLGLRTSVVVVAEPVAAVSLDVVPEAWNNTLPSDLQLERRARMLEKRVRGRVTVSTLQAFGAGLIPSLQDVRHQIQAAYVGSHTCLMWTGIGPNAQVEITQWYNCNIRPLSRDPFTGDTPPRDPVTLTPSTDWGYIEFQLDVMKDIDAITANVPGAGLRDGNGVIWARGTFDALHSQAFAEQCTGIVYYFTDQNVNGVYNPTAESVWRQWELPALLQSGRVTAIVQVNPAYTYTVQNNVVVHPNIIWTPNQGIPYGPPRAGYRYTSEIHPGFISPTLVSGQTA